MGGDSGARFGWRLVLVVVMAVSVGFGSSEGWRECVGLHGWGCRWGWGPVALGCAGVEGVGGD